MLGVNPALPPTGEPLCAGSGGNGAIPVPTACTGLSPIALAAAADAATAARTTSKMNTIFNKIFFKCIPQLDSPITMIKISPV